MYPILVLAIGALLALFIEGNSVQYRDLTQMYLSRTRQMQVIALAESIEQYYQEARSLPTNLSTLAATNGFQQTRSSMNNWQSYGVSQIIDDGVWRFSRAVIFSNDPTGGITPIDYLSKNACGVGSFSTAISWCGLKDSRWFRRETKESYPEEIANQRIRMGRMMQKFSDHYNSKKSFPNKDGVGSDLAINSINKLSTLVGYAGNAQECSGTFSYMNVPVDCGDIFDMWGGHIGYQFVGNKRIILTAETPIFNSNSNRVVVAVEYDYSLF